jgi:hypothetical protein
MAIRAQRHRVSSVRTGFFTRLDYDAARLASVALPNAASSSFRSASRRANSTWY